MFMGGSCNIKRPPTTLLYHRVPYNFEIFDIKVILLRPDCTSLFVIRNRKSWVCFLLLPFFFLQFTYVIVVVKVGVPEDFSTEPQTLHSEPINMKKASATYGDRRRDKDFFFFPIFFFSSGSMSHSSSKRDAFEASKKTVNDSNNSKHTYTCSDILVRTLTHIMHVSLLRNKVPFISP